AMPSIRAMARRVVRMAVEDIGLADPQALPLTIAAQQAVHFLGQPEGDLALAQAVVYLAQAPKSNAVYSGYGAALKDVAETRNEPVPLHLRNAPTRLMKDLGYGKGYKYAHDFTGAQVDQEHFPANLQGRRYYEPTGRGFEQQIRERLAWRDTRPMTKDQRPKTGAQGSDIGNTDSSLVIGPSSLVDPQALAGEESQDVGEDDGAQVRRPATGASKRPGKPGRRNG
ncbi:MAG TPA: replication-associated recombination protein A, partial [Roseiflexaceae bacterium]|nr:replication-associated recombination protein A [Roseiflexaceae bacterium]